MDDVLLKLNSDVEFSHQCVWLLCVLLCLPGYYDFRYTSHHSISLLIISAIYHF